MYVTITVSTTLDRSFDFFKFIFFNGATGVDNDNTLGWKLQKQPNGFETLKKVCILMFADFFGFFFFSSNELIRT